ncbi:MAG TPA: DNA gyrase/topoisomerase IV subunit A, partial [Chitinophagaceae bacterium]|nr:DNA gyrase/topoisomerase IV subunit A [Chitinophagaceae bacterium]
QTMQYHPHGDAAIGEAIVGLGQKDLLIETQGNWGDNRTGDSAAASRYIEARLSKFALEVAFNPKTTEWQLSYDGRKNEPLNLPMKFPLVLAQGVEGIAVGLSTKILPHNFCELLQAAIKHLQGKYFKLYPDFPNGGIIDVDEYNDGKRGGKVKARAHIEIKDKKTLLIKDVPYGVTTTQLMDSITKANNAGKIKIKKVIDNTAEHIEIEIQLPTGVSPDITVDALYAFTHCEISISPNTCVIVNDKPQFLGTKDLLQHSVEHTKGLLKQELEIKLHELQEDWHYSSLEKIFIEKRIYRDIEEETTWEGVLTAIDKGLEPYKDLFKRTIIREDIIRLTEIKIKRISKYDTFRADEHIKGVEEGIEQVAHDLAHLVDFTIAYYENLLKKYGKGRERKTEIRSIENIKARQVAIANSKLYMNAADGFIGTSLKKDEFVCECSDIDNVIVFTKNGTMKVVKVTDKVFIGKNIIYAAVFRKGDERMTYNMIYRDGKSGVTYAKRFNVKSVTRNREYLLAGKNKKSKVLYFTANPNGEAEVVNILLSPSCNARKKNFDFYFEEIAIKGRSSKGNQVTKYPVRKTRFKEAGRTTLSALKIWYDDTIGRLNTKEHGMLVGDFENDDRIIAFYNDGSYEITNYELTNRYDRNELVAIEKLNPDAVITAIYYDDEKKQFNVKRFLIETQTEDQRFIFIKEGRKNYLELVTMQRTPKILLTAGKSKAEAKSEVLDLTEMVDVMGWKAFGNRLTDKVRYVNMELLESEEIEEEEVIQDKKDKEEEEDDTQGSLF